MKKLSQFLKTHISGTFEAILLKFGMWSTEVRGRVHSKNRLVSSRQHRATEVRKLRFPSSCQYTHGCCAPASWAAQHTTVCLDWLTRLLQNMHTFHTIQHTFNQVAKSCESHVGKPIRFMYFSAAIKTQNTIIHAIKFIRFTAHACVPYKRTYTHIYICHTAPPSVFDITTQTDNDDIKITWKVRSQ